jgi:hypothetical protein
MMDLTAWVHNLAQGKVIRSSNFQRVSVVAKLNIYINGNSTQQECDLISHQSQHLWLINRWN